MRLVGAPLENRRDPFETGDHDLEKEREMSRPGFMILCPRKAGISLFALLALLLPSCSGGGGSSSSSSNTGKKGAEDLKILTESLPSGEKGKAYQALIEVSGGLPPYVYTVAEGTLPPGLNIDNSNGLISGTPEKAGRFTVKTAVVDASIPSQKAAKSFEILVTDLGASTMDVTLKATRNQGVAPLAVFFDASGTTSLDVKKPFHHLLFEWDFDDPGSLRPKASGPLAAHVFEKPGTYKVKLTVENPKGEVSRKTLQITVQDPAKVFSGANTICFSNTSDFTGAPKDAKKVQTNDFAYALSFADKGKRLLFKRGDTFLSNRTFYFNPSGPGILGAFGEGKNKDERGIYANDPVIFAPDGNQRKILVFQSSDWRVVNLNFQTPAGSKVWSAVDADRHIDRLTLLRLTTGHFHVSIGLADDIIQARKEKPFDQITIADCHLKDSGINTVYMGGENVAVLGNFLDKSPHSHVFRLSYGKKVVFAHNTFLRSSWNRHLLKIHSRSFPAFGIYTEKILITDNRFYCNSQWPLTLGPQDGLHDERVRDVILQKNLFVVQENSEVILHAAAGDVTFRNNVMVDQMKNGYNFFPVTITRTKIEPEPWGIEIYHNTYYSPGWPHTIVGLVQMENCRDRPVIENNILYSSAKNAGHFRLVNLRNPKFEYTASGNLTGKDPLFTDPARMDFSLKAGSPAVDAGVSVPVMDDFRGESRPKGGAPDAGAYESH